MSQTFKDIIQVVAFMQGSFFYGFCTVALWHLLYRERHLIRQNAWRVLIFIAIMLITGCTLLTLYRAPYSQKDYWYWIVIVAYLLLDVGVVYQFRKELLDYNTRELNRSRSQTSQNSPK